MREHLFFQFWDTQKKQINFITKSFFITNHYSQKSFQKLLLVCCCIRRIDSTKAVVQTCSITQNASNFIEKETLAQFFSRKFFEIFKNTFFYRTLPVTASAYMCSVKSCCIKFHKSRRKIPVIKSCLLQICRCWLSTQKGCIRPCQ